MKCVICHGEDIGIKRIDEEICHGDDIIRVPLEIHVCAGCGERYYDRATMQRLEQIRQRVRNQEVTLREVGKVLVCEG